jgi:hypothetical protein
VEASGLRRGAGSRREVGHAATRAPSWLKSFVARGSSSSDYSIDGGANLSDRLTPLGSRARAASHARSLSALALHFGHSRRTPSFAARSPAASRLRRVVPRGERDDATSILNQGRNQKPSAPPRRRRTSAGLGPPDCTRVAGHTRCTGLPAANPRRAYRPTTRWPVSHRRARGSTVEDSAGRLSLSFAAGGRVIPCKA